MFVYLGLLKSIFILPLQEYRPTNSFPDRGVGGGGGGADTEIDAKSLLS